MLRSMIAAALAFAFMAAPATAAAARPTADVTQFCGDRYCAQAAPAKNDRRAGKRAHRQTRAAAKPTAARDHATADRHGLQTIDTAAGIPITGAPAFVAKAADVIAGAVAEGMKFRRINCFSMARSHRSRSNHKTGEACDTYPSIPARIVRANGLRSGCDFADCQHFDNARNVGGMAFWNSVRHARTSARGRQIARR